jgi:hypothetical protein
MDDDAPAWTPAALARSVAGDTLRLDTPVRLERWAARADAPEPARTMPDLRGKSVRQAVAWLRALGVEPVVRGAGTVRQQSVRPGARLPARVTLAGQRGTAP